jgi:hypothetical protein
VTRHARKIKRAIPNCLWVAVSWQEPMGHPCWAVVAQMVGDERRTLVGGQYGPRRALRRAWREVKESS